MRADYFHNRTENHDRPQNTEHRPPQRTMPHKIQIHQQKRRVCAGYQRINRYRIPNFEKTFAFVTNRHVTHS